MTLTTHTLGNSVVVIELQGRFETTGAQEFVLQFNDLLDDGVDKLIVDLGQVKLMGSTGLAALIYALKRLRERRGDLHLCCVPDTVQQVFKLTRLQLVFRIFRDQHEAQLAFWA